MYSHRLIYPLWLVQGCELFPSPSPSHKVLECLPPGTLLPGWSVCIVKFKDYFNCLGQCCLDVELKISLSHCRVLWLCRYLFYYVTSVLQAFRKGGHLHLKLHNLWQYKNMFILIQNMKISYMAAKTYKFLRWDYRRMTTENLIFIILNVGWNVISKENSLCIIPTTCLVCNLAVLTISHNIRSQDNIVYWLGYGLENWGM